MLAADFKDESVEPTIPFPRADHDHTSCIAAILSAAAELCALRRVRLTEQRRRVLEIIAHSHAAIGAYEILERMTSGGKRPAPITVYRALEFLIQQGLVHRLATLNAYVACANAIADHGTQFLICKRCGMIGEVSSQAVDRAIFGAASDVGFVVSSPVIEVAGLCSDCHSLPHDGNRP